MFSRVDSEVGSSEVGSEQPRTRKPAVAAADPRLHGGNQMVARLLGAQDLSIRREPDGQADARAAQVAQDRAGQLSAVRAALSQADPVAGVGNFPEAFRLLNGLSVDDQMWVMRELNRSGQLQVLLAHQAEAAPFNRQRLLATMSAARLADTPAESVGTDEYRTIGTALDQVPDGDRMKILNALAHMRLSPEIAVLTMEGIALMMASALTPPTVNPGFVGAHGPVEAGPWAPPGGQPIPFYLGNAAHIAIAAEYRLANAGDQIATNSIPVESILEQFAEPPFGLKPTTKGMRRTRLEGKPDIANLTKRHIYEIKPNGSESVGRSEARWYVESFVAAGVPMQLGPLGAPGVNGVLPAPGGVYLFECLEPGVITYQLRRARLEEVTVTSPEGQTSKRFELRPLPANAQVALVAGTAMLLMYLMYAAMAAAASL